jgi:hypothetical protein
MYRGHARLALVVLLLVLLLAAVAYVGLLARDTWDATSTGRAALNQGIAMLDTPAISNLDATRLDRATADFRLAEASFARARTRLGFWGDWATAHPGLLPGPARQLAAAAPLLDLGRDTAASAAILSTALVPVATTLKTTPDPPSQSAAANGSLARFVTALDAARPALVRAAAEFAGARAARTRLTTLPPVPAAATLLATFDRRAPELANALTYAQALPGMLGAAGPRSYLVVYQDAADLRATGGFMGAAALFTLDHGRLSEIDYETTADQLGPNNLQIPANLAGEPPLPLQYYRGLSEFQLRDANFWPDFPTSARQIAGRYRLATGRQVAGVIAVNPAAISHLLGALGPLRVPGYPDTITAANVLDRVEYYSHDRPKVIYDPYRNRFLVVASHTVFNALLHLHASQLSSMVSAVESAFADRSVLVSVSEPLFAHALNQAHWDGALRTDRGDYLGVYDQNVTDSKLNPFVDESIAYTVTRRPDDSLQCQISITYINHTAHTSFWVERPYYQDYLRVAVPGSSSVQDLQNFSETWWPNERERGRLLIVGGLYVPARHTVTVSIHYRIPASALAGISGYRLLVQEQPGKIPPMLSVQVHAGTRTWTADTVLRHDTVFSTAWDAPSGMLRVQRG